MARVGDSPTRIRTLTGLPTDIFMYALYETYEKLKDEIKINSEKTALISVVILICTKVQSSRLG